MEYFSKRLKGLLVIFKKICSDAQTPNHFDFKSAYDGLKAELIDKEMIELKTPNDRVIIPLITKQCDFGVLRY